MQQFQSDRGNVFVQDGYTYLCNRYHNGVRYLMCVESVRCSSRGVWKDGDERCTYTDHLHNPDELAVDKLLFRMELRRRASTERIKPRALFDFLSQQFPRVAATIGYPAVRSLIYRCRRNGVPPVPHSLSEFGRILQQDAWSHLTQVISDGNDHHGDPFFRGVIGSEAEGWMAAVYTSPRLAEALSNTTRLHIDGTFKTLPQDLNAHQLLTVHAEYQTHLFPVAFVVMTRRSQLAYEGVFRYLHQIIPGWQPEAVLTDFEVACRNAAQTVWPAARLVGCFFHYAQAIYQTHKRLNLTHVVQGSPEAKKALHMLMALALLPSGKILQGLDVTSYYLEQHDLLNTFQPLMRYMEDYWVTTVGINRFSVYRECHRTNNALEGFHSSLLRRMGPHPTVWDFHAVLRDIEQHQYLDLLRLRQNIPHVRPRQRRDRQRDRAIHNATTNLDQGRLSIAAFLDSMAHITLRIGETADHGQRGNAGAPEAGHLHLPAIPVMRPAPDAHLMGQDNMDEDLLDEFPHIPEMNHPAPGPIRRRRAYTPRRRTQGERLVDVNPQPAAAAPPAEDHLQAALPLPPAPLQQLFNEQSSGEEDEDQALPAPRNALPQDQPYYDNYKGVPTTHRPGEEIPMEFIERQAQDLLLAIGIRGNSVTCVEALDNDTACYVCLLNKADRTASPCGHNIVCSDCLPAFVNKQLYESVTTPGGGILELPFRMPRTCPNCRALIGYIIARYD